MTEHVVCAKSVWPRLKDGNNCQNNKKHVLTKMSTFSYSGPKSLRFVYMYNLILKKKTNCTIQLCITLYPTLQTRKM